MELIRSYLIDCDSGWNEVKKRTGVKKLADWPDSNLSTSGSLAGEPDISYQFHSERPELNLTFADEEKSIDMIFLNDKPCVFDHQRLRSYVTNYSTHFQEYKDDAILEKAIIEVKDLKLIDATDLDGVYRLHQGFIGKLFNS
jgi:hypothetical protein